VALSLQFRFPFFFSDAMRAMSSRGLKLAISFFLFFFRRDAGDEQPRLDYNFSSVSYDILSFAEVA
jgi:hypothetical protein